MTRYRLWLCALVCIGSLLAVAALLMRVERPAPQAVAPALAATACPPHAPKLP